MNFHKRHDLAPGDVAFRNTTYGAYYRVVALRGPGHALVCYLGGQGRYNDSVLPLRLFHRVIMTFNGPVFYE